MKKLIFWLCFFPLIVSAQVSEDFENGTIERWFQSDNGRWAASAIEPITGNFSLHHIFDNPSADYDRISIPVYSICLDSAITTWRFNIRHGFTPSSANNWGVFLVSDQDATQMHPAGTASGYVVGVNYTGSDDLVKLWKVTSGSETEILATGFDWEETISTADIAGFEVTRSGTGLWEVKIDSTGGFDDLVSFGDVSDPDHVSLFHFGMYYKYSSGQDMKLWIDDISIQGYSITDTIKPYVTQIRVEDASGLQITFSEPVDIASATLVTNYLLNNGGGNPVTVTMAGTDRVLLTFPEDFTDGLIYELQVGQVRDHFRNIMDTVFLQFKYYRVKQYDVVINEIMADPVPSLGLPESEYIELYNRSRQALILKGWFLQVGTVTRALGSIDIPEDGFIVLCSPDAATSLSQYGTVSAVAGFPVLANTGQTVTLRNEAGQVITSVTYSDRWYGDDYKAEGGWSLEQIDPANPCGGESNWSASENRQGGTPGRTNSIMAKNPDMESPGLVNAYLLGDTLLFLYFSETYDTIDAGNPLNYTVDQGIGNPDQVSLISPEYRSLILGFGKEFERGLIYSVTTGNFFTDCAGNTIGVNDTRRFGQTETPDTLDTVINEVLFNPFAGGVDYIELYNRSGKILDLGDIIVASRDEKTGALKTVVQVTEYPLLFFPGDYVALSIDAKKVYEQYYTPFPHNFIDLRSMPSMPDDRGRVVLATRWLDILDEFAYHEEMHFPLLRFREGVSLERINMHRPTRDITNWHSAAESAGFGTPAYKNSQYSESPVSEITIQIEPEIFSPDNDGYHDLVHLHYHFELPGYVASVTVFDARGRLVKQVIRNELLGMQGTFSWDGTDQANQMAPVGIYLFYIEIFDLKGNVHRYKRTCVLAKKLY